MNADFVLSTQCACLDDEGNAWIFSNEINALFYKKLESGITEYITGFDREAFWMKELYTDMIWFHGKLFLIPNAAKDIAVYDTVREYVEYISLCTPPDNYNVVRLPEDRLFLYSVRARPSAYIIYLKKMCCEHISIDYGEKKNILEGKLLRGTAYCNGKAYFVVDKTNQYVEFDIDTKTVRLRRTEKEIPLFHAASDGQCLYMMHDDGCAYDAYDKSGYIKTYRLLEKLENKKNDCQFERTYVFNIVLEDGSIVSTPLKKQPVIVMKNGKFIRFPLEDKKIGRYINDLQPLCKCESFQNKLVLFPYHSDVLVIIDLITAEVEYQSAKIDIMRYGRLIKNILDEHKGIVYETQISLEAFLNALGYDSPNTERKHENGSRKIHQSMLEDNSGGGRK